MKGQGKKASLDGFEVFQEDLQVRNYNEKLLKLPKDIVLKARAVLLQSLKGNHEDLQTKDSEAIKLQDKEAIYKLWDTLKGNSSKDAKSQLLNLFNSHFKDIYSS